MSKRIAELERGLRDLLTRVQLEMRTGRLPIDWADGLIARTRALLDGPKP